MAPDESARLMLAIEEGVIEPQAKSYMKGLLQRERFGGHGSFGRGLPPGTDYRAKIGNAYDTLQEIAAITLPDRRRFVIAAFSDGLNQEDPEPHDVGTLGDYVEELLEVLPTPGSASSGGMAQNRECAGRASRLARDRPRRRTLGVGQGAHERRRGCLIHLAGRRAGSRPI